MEKTIKHLRLYFKTVNAAFGVISAIKGVKNKNTVPYKIQELHKIGLEEIEKDEPDLLKVNSIIREIETFANPIPTNPSGCN